MRVLVTCWRLADKATGAIPEGKKMLEDGSIVDATAGSENVEGTKLRICFSCRCGIRLKREIHRFIIINSSIQKKMILIKN